MIEPYQWLFTNAETLGYKKENVGPASVDLELGEVKYFSTWSNAFNTVKTNCKSNYIFEPGVFYLASTLEHIKVPSTHCAFINMRSSFARKGLGHKMAGFIDPGFEGQITLELETNVTLFIPMHARIVQLIYCRLTEETTQPYTGKYLNQKGPTESYV